MKIALLALFVFVCVVCRANDTLSNARVYNINVGDTFDYEHRKWVSYNSQHLVNYYVFSRRVIIDKYYLNSELHIVRSNPALGTNDTIQIADTSQMAYLNYPTDSTFGSGCPMMLGIYGNYNGRAVNTFNNSCLGYSRSVDLVEGLGEIHTDTAGGSVTDGASGGGTRLVYYSKGIEKYGSPYEILEGRNLLHYTPLPEECAVWTNEIMHSEVLRIQEQVRTGNKVTNNNHAYVELLYTSFDYRKNEKTTDSLIGYFRNDTINKLVKFAHYLGAQESILYDFSYINGTKAGYGYITLDTTYINGQLRTTWQYPKPRKPGQWYSAGTIPETYIEGIGSTSGLITVKFDPADYYTQSTLTCFSVCGQTIYPQATAGNCAAITSIKDPVNEEFYFTIYPTVAADVLNINPTGVVEYTYLISTITGQAVAVGNLNENGKIGVGLLPGGMYILHLQGENLKTRAARFVISR